jgi:hypothetical protein
MSKWNLVAMSQAGLIGWTRVAAKPVARRTGRPKPDIGSQPGTVETNPDGTTDIYFGPTAPVAGPAIGSRPSRAKASS